MMAQAHSLGLLDLPNEVLLHILHPLRTPELLPLTSLNHRFHNIILRILYVRLSVAASLYGRTLVFECYPPHLKLYDRYMLGNYLGTDGLESILADTDDQPPGKQLGDINTLYSRFRPYRLVEKKVQWKHPAGDVPGSRTFGQANYYGNNSTVRNFSVAQNYGGDYTGQPVESEAGQPDTASSSQQQSSEPGDSRSLDSSQGDRSEREELPQSASDSASRTQHDSDSNAETTRRRSTRLSAVTSGPPPPHTEKIRVLVNLDDGDNLQQLIANVDLAVPGPRPDIFRALQHIVSDGYLRVWRWWLAERSQLQKQLDDAAADAIVEDEVLASDANAASTGKGKGRLTESDATMTAPDYKKDESILWVGHRSLVGVRLSVREKKWNRPAPVLMRASDDGPASYEIVYEELLVRTRDLLLASERLHEQQHSDAGKAIVFGTWVAEGSS